LAKAPAERVQSAAELIGDIDAIAAEHGSANPLASHGAPPVAAWLPVACRSGAASGRGQPPGPGPLITTLSGAARRRRPPPAARSRRWRSVAIATAAAAMLAAAVAMVVRPDHDWFWSTSAPVSAAQPRPGGAEPGNVVVPDAAVATDAAAPVPEPTPAP